MSKEPTSNHNVVTTWSAPSVPARPSYGLSLTADGGGAFGGGEDAKTFDLARMLQIFMKHRYVIGAVVAAALIIGLIVTLTAVPYYQSTVTIETASATVQVMNDQSLQPQSMQDPQEIATYVELLSSRSLAERVVNDLNLADDPSFLKGKGGSSLFSRVSRLLFGGADPSTDQDLAQRQRAAVSQVLANVTAKVVRTSRLLTVSYSDSNPKRAQRIANALAEGFIKANLDRRFDATAYARRFLEDQLQQVKLKLADSEQKVVAYADKEKLVSLDNMQLLLSTQLESINKALADASIARMNAEQLWLSVKDVKEYSDIPTQSGPDNSTGSDSVIIQLRNTRSALMADYQEKLLQFKPSFPTMIALKSRIDDVDNQIAEEVEKTKNEIHSAYELSVEREQALTVSLDEATKQLIDTRNRMVDYTMLQREAATNRTLYDGLLQRYKEISVMGGVAANGLSIVDEATLPGVPYSPRKSLNMAIALLAGLLLGAGIAMGMEYFDNTIKTPDQIEALFGIPVLGLIPVLGKDESVQEALNDPHSSLSEAYRSARTALQFSTDRGVPKTLVVTSARPGEGKTTTTTTLARMFGQIGVKVLIIDGDLRNPSLHKVLGIENSMGLSNYLTGSVDHDEVLRPGMDANVSVISSGPIPPNPAELLSSSKTLGLLSELRERFDLILIDSAPVMGLADALLLSSVADGTLLVCAANEAPTETLKAAIKRIVMANGQLIGALLTKFDAHKAGYGYAYYGYNYYGYGRENQPKALPPGAAGRQSEPAAEV